MFLVKAKSSSITLIKSFALHSSIIDFSKASQETVVVFDLSKLTSFIISPFLSMNITFLSPFSFILKIDIFPVFKKYTLSTISLSLNSISFLASCLSLRIFFSSILLLSFISLNTSILFICTPLLFI